jgi:hypothetical protein
VSGGQRAFIQGLSLVVRGLRRGQHLARAQLDLLLDLLELPCSPAIRWCGPP